MWWIIPMVLALAAGIYVGLGAPGFPGRKDRVVPGGHARRLKQRRLDWLRPLTRSGEKRRSASWRV